MDINGKRIMVFGAYGQCGAAITKLILRSAAPEQLILTSLHKSEADSIGKEARHWAGLYQPDSLIDVVSEAGNILLSDRLEQMYKRLRAGENVEADYLDGVIRFIFREYSEFSSEDKQDVFIYRLLTKYQPHILIDCVNTATGLAYQDIFSLAKAYLERKRGADGKDAASSMGDGVPLAERLLMATSLPSLIRHVEILNDALLTANVRMYLKVGTTGTGGMGLNIPYTHSESKPSRTLMSKSAVAGAASLLYLLMNRTAGNPIIKEIKPAALIGWKSIGFGEIRKHGVPVQLWDCPLDRGVPLNSTADAFSKPPGERLDGTLKAVYIDTGENGVFSASEFETITSLEQMELVTPEDVARAAMEEICGESTGFDIVGALNAVCLDSSYRGGVMRGSALQQLAALEREHQQEGVAFEILGPPRLSKLLWEGHLLRRHGQLEALLVDVFSERVGAPVERRLEIFDNIFDPAALCSVVTDELAADQETRSRILSIGLPIATMDLKLLYGPVVALMRAYPGLSLGQVLSDPKRRRSFIENGAVELLPSNFERWKGWIAAALRYHFLSKEPGMASTSSASDQRNLFTPEYDESGGLENVAVHLGELVGWLFTTVERGSRRRHHFTPD